MSRMVGVAKDVGNSQIEEMVGGRGVVVIVFCLFACKVK